MAGRPSNKQLAAQEQARQLRRSLLNESAFAGGFDVDEDITPSEAALEELRRSLAFVRWIEYKMQEWAPELFALGIEHYDNKDSLQVVPTHEAAWLDVWRAERNRLTVAIKLCHDIGVDERLVAVQEEQADIMFRVLEMAFDALQLTAEQQASLPQIMPRIIRAVALPGGQGIDQIREEM